VDYHLWQRWAWPVLLLTLAALVVLILPGTEAVAPRINGARRWLRVGGNAFQPSEAARFALVAWAAMVATRKGDRIGEFRRGMLPVLLVTGLTCLLVLLQPNLSMAVVLAVLGGVVLFTAGARIGQFLLTGVAAAFVTVAAIQAMPYRFTRVKCFLGMATDCGGTDWQVDQAMLGFASGRWLGVGFGEGQLKLNYLPYASSDFLFSTIGEEWGLAGVLCVILLFTVFGWLGFRIARTAADPFGRFLAAGLTSAVTVTALMHMAVNMDLMPTTGITLPFMTSGRSSLLVTLFTVGVLISIGRRREGPAAGSRRGR
jgi:cell division protein FtsW